MPRRAARLCPRRLATRAHSHHKHRGPWVCSRLCLKTVYLHIYIYKRDFGAPLFPHPQPPPTAAKQRLRALLLSTCPPPSFSFFFPSSERPPTFAPCALLCLHTHTFCPVPQSHHVNRLLLFSLVDGLSAVVGCLARVACARSGNMGGEAALRGRAGGARAPSPRAPFEMQLVTSSPFTIHDSDLRLIFQLSSSRKRRSRTHTSSCAALLLKKLSDPRSTAASTARPHTFGAPPLPTTLLYSYTTRDRI